MYWWYVSRLIEAVMLHTFGKWILDIMNNDSSCTCYIMYYLVLSSNVLNSLWSLSVCRSRIIYFSRQSRRASLVASIAKIERSSTSLGTWWRRLLVWRCNVTKTDEEELKYQHSWYWSCDHRVKITDIVLLVTRRFWIIITQKLRRLLMLTDIAVCPVVYSDKSFFTVSAVIQNTARDITVLCGARKTHNKSIPCKQLKWLIPFLSDIFVESLCSHITKQSDQGTISHKTVQQSTVGKWRWSEGHH